MYWLQSPPYLKRAGVVALLLAALAWDLRAAATEPFPTAAIPLTAGAPITAEAVAWIDLPRDRMPVPDLSDMTAARAIGVGEPLTASLLAGPFVAPPGWWTIPIEIGALAVPGDEVMLVTTEPAITATGVVVSAQSGDPFSLSYRPAAVAVPPGVAAAVAAAERADRLITAVRPTTGDR